MFKLIKQIILIVLLIAIIIYAITRIFFSIALAHEYSIFENTISLMLLFGELFILVHATGYAINLFRSSRAKDIVNVSYKHLSSEFPSVAILVAARHEPFDVLDKTFSRIRNIRYPNKFIYFLDDSSDEKYKKEAEELCKKHNLILFRRKKEWHGAKAGIINDCLVELFEKYVAVFDADQSPLPDFLNMLIPLLENDEKLAFIQTPQFYSNIDKNRVAKGSGFQQSVFYEYICEAKNSSQSMFCCGTNVVFRREALVSVGGMDETVVTEDFATSIKLHINKWKSLYFNHVGTFGMGPETLGAYFTTQASWSKGTVGVFRKVLFQFIKNPFCMSISQWWEYFLSGTYYFVGLAFLFLMICPITYIMLSVPSFFINADIYLSVFIPYFALSLGVFLTTLATRHYKAKDVFLGQMLIYISFPVLIKSTLYGLLGVQGKFGITQKGKSSKLPLIYLWPQLLFVVLNFIALVWGLNRFYYEQDFSILVNVIWIAYHWMIMLGIFYFNEGD